MSSSRSKYFLLAGIFAVVVIIDQWTKHLILINFRWGESLAVIPNFFSLTYVRNSGAAFGLLHSAPAAFRDPFFIAVPIIAMGAIFYLFSRLKPSQKWVAVALSLILSGAFGNLVDRLRFGYVVDFLDVHWKDFYHWPAFNVADACIVVGVTMMFIDSFTAGKKAAQAN